MSYMKTTDLTTKIFFIGFVSCILKAVTNVGNAAIYPEKNTPCVYNEM